MRVGARKNKYGAVRCELDGFSFDSKMEMRHYCELALRVKACEISDLKVHPKYPIEINGIKVCDVEMDFVYTDAATGTIHVIDVKGSKVTQTPLSRLKRKLLEAYYLDVKVEIV